MKPRFKFLTGDINWLQYGGKWISQKLNNGDWDYFLVLELINWHDTTGEKDKEKYLVQLFAVSPQAAGEKNLNKAFECCGVEKDNPARQSELAQVECLQSYGVTTPVGTQWTGNNAYKLLKLAKKESIAVQGLFGFYMDTPKNRIGSTGWDLIKGDILAGLKT